MVSRNGDIVILSSFRYVLHLYQDLKPSFPWFNVMDVSPIMASKNISFDLSKWGVSVVALSLFIW